MNWYKLAQNLPFSWENVEGIVYTTEAQADLRNFKKSQGKRNAAQVSFAVQENIDSRIATLRESVRKNNVRIYVFEPHGIGLAIGQGRGYRICAQVCSLGGENATMSRISLREQEIQKTGKKFLLIKRIFENHDEYISWLNRDEEKHRDECEMYSGAYSRIRSSKVDDSKIVPLDAENPHAWLTHVVGLMRDKNIQKLYIHKEMLSGKSEEELFKILDFVTKNGNKFPVYMFNEILSWIEDSIDKLG